MPSIFASTIICLLLSTFQYAASESFIPQAVATGQFGILNTTLAAYNLPVLLASLGGQKITIFGPTDTAFTEAGITDGASLEQAVLLRHGVLGEYTSATIAATPCQEIASLSGPILVIQTAVDGSITVNGVTVDTALVDITGDEGVFHGMNGVIPASYPACPTDAPEPTDAPQAVDDSASFQMLSQVGIAASALISSALLLIL